VDERLAMATGQSADYRVVLPSHKKLNRVSFVLALHWHKTICSNNNQLENDRATKLRIPQKGERSQLPLFLSSQSIRISSASFCRCAIEMEILVTSVPPRDPSRTRSSSEVLMIHERCNTNPGAHWRSFSRSQKRM
jgi:hypothetical protein